MLKKKKNPVNQSFLDAVVFGQETYTKLHVHPILLSSKECQLPSQQKAEDCISVKWQDSEGLLLLLAPPSVMALTKTKINSGVQEKSSWGSQAGN